MNVQRLLLFCFLSALWDGNAGIYVFQRYSGDGISYSWSFASNASVRFFCRRECQGSDVLIRTDQNKSVSGRYSIEYQKTPKGGYVTGFISSLETSDSGRYRIGVGRSLVPDEFWDFEIRVTGGFSKAAEDPHNGTNIHTVEEGGFMIISCKFPFSSSTKFFCRNDCSNSQLLLRTTGDEAQSGGYLIKYVQEYSETSFIVFIVIFSLELSDSGLYSCGLGESLTSASFYKFNILVTADPSATSVPPSTTPSSGSPPFSPPPESFSQFPVLLVVGGSVLIGGMSAVVVLLLYKLKKKNQEIRNMESAAYENLRGDSNYQSLNLDGKDQEQICSTL